MKKTPQIMVEKGSHDYDYVNDSYYTYMIEKKYESSFQIGSLIIDLDNKNRVVGVEILDASSVIGIPKQHLRNIGGGQVKVNAENNKVFINMQLMIVLRNAKKTHTLRIGELYDEDLEVSPMTISLSNKGK